MRRLLSGLGLFCVLLAFGCGNSSETPAKNENTTTAAETKSDTVSGVAEPGPQGLAKAELVANKPDKVGGQPTTKAVAAAPPTPPVHAAPATVTEAMRAFDLRTLEIPEGAELTQKDIGDISFTTTADLGEVTDKIVDQLKKSGWTLENKNSYDTEQSKYSSFEWHKQGFVLNLSIYQSGEGTPVNVTASNAGNIDVRELPAPKGSSPLGGGTARHTVIHVTSAPVAEAMQDALTQLSAAGWKPYEIPDNESDPNAPHQTAKLIRNGVELTVFIGVAPAQGGKTTVQYGCSMLPYELAMTPDAQSLRLDTHSGNLMATTQLPIGEVLSHYQKFFTSQGWKQGDKVHQSEKSGLSFFQNGNDVIAVSVVKEENETRLRVQALVAKKEESADTQKEETPEELPVEKLPLADGAKGVNVDEKGNRASYQTRLSPSEVVSFYQKNMKDAKWVERADATVKSDVLGQYSADRDDGTMVFVNAIYDPTMPATEVSLTAIGFRWSVDGVPGSASTSDAGNTGANKPLTLENVQGLPIPSDHQGYGTSSSRYRKEIEASSPSSVATVAELYRRGLAEQGWISLDDAAAPKSEVTRLGFRNGGEEMTIELLPEQDRTMIRLATRSPELARQAGILPDAGKALLLAVNDAEIDANLTINGRPLSVAAGVGRKRPDGPRLTLEPGEVTVVVKFANKPEASDQFVVGPGETWSVIILPEGPLPLRMY